MVNRDLRELVSLAAALATVEQDGWQSVTSSKVSCLHMPGPGGQDLCMSAEPTEHLASDVGLRFYCKA